MSTIFQLKSPSESNPWIGRSVGDRQRYRLDECLATGGMGEVFVAMDTLLGKQVALKLLKDTLVASAELRKRFEREVSLCAALKSDHIVEVSDYGMTTEGYPFFVMEYLRGQSLGQLLQHKQRLPLEQTVNLIAQVCDGLQLAHEGVTLWRENATVSEQIKVVHCDLKPDNIFLVPTALGELVKVLDFGVAKIRQTQAEHSNLTNMFLGTFHYAAPEQLKVEKDLDGRADIYSLGIIIYEMLSGTDPFGLGFNKITNAPINNISWALAHTSSPPLPLRSQPGLSQISPELDAVVMRCLKKVPAERFASVDELKRALQATILNTQQSQQNLGKKNNILDLAASQVAEEHNLNPTLVLRETWGGETKKNPWQLLPIITAVAAVIVGVACYYYHAQGQVDKPENAVLEDIQLFKERNNYQECVNKAKAVLPTSTFYTKAQNLINECQRLATDEKLLTQAKELAQKKNFKDAISEASKIQLGTSRPLAQQLIEQWSVNLVKQSEERYKGLSRTNNALQPELPPPQPIPSPVPYLSRRPVQTKPIQSRRSKLLPLQRTNNALQPKLPPPQPILSPVPYLSRQLVQPKPIQSPRSNLVPLQLSPEAQRILCQQFPLNSRCSGSKH